MAAAAASFFRVFLQLLILGYMLRTSELEDIMEKSGLKFRYSPNIAFSFHP